MLTNYWYNCLISVDVRQNTWRSYALRSRDRKDRKQKQMPSKEKKVNLYNNQQQTSPTRKKHQHHWWTTIVWGDSLNQPSLNGPLMIQRLFPRTRIHDAMTTIVVFTQSSNETLCKTWEQFKFMFRKCPCHIFDDITHIHIFINGLQQQHNFSLTQQ